MSYKVKLDLFEGPFELLIYLIEHARMSVYDIKVAEITTQYLEYVEDLRQIDPRLAQEFMVLAAELIEIKSRMLLPVYKAEGGDLSEDDPRADLVRRILEYKQFKDAAAMLEEREEALSHVHSKPQEDLIPWIGEEDELLTASTEQFVRAFEAFLHRREKLSEMKRTYQQIERRRITMENKMAEIGAMFKEKKTLLFSEIIKKDPSVFNRILTFMSLLEMVKTGDFTAVQKKRYGDITITRLEDTGGAFS